MIPLHPAIDIVATGFEASVGYPDALFRQIGHPVTWFGALLRSLDRRLNRDADAPPRRRSAGAMTIVTLVVASGLAGLALQGIVVAACPRVVAILVVAVLASSCLAQRSLDAHVRDVRDALRDNGLKAGRIAVSMIVGRDTDKLDTPDVVRAAIESLAENYSDGIVAPSLYIAIGGLPGGLIYKAINTADSMIGHKTPRHVDFGFAAAKLDDLVNWPAARLAGFWIVLAAAILPSASADRAWRVMWRDARGHASPNAGWPEAAMAGALGVRLGGPRVYAGKLVVDTPMGDEGPIEVETIDRALKLYRIACGLNVLAIVIVALVIARVL